MAGRLPGPDGATRSALVDHGTHVRIESAPFRPADGACSDAARDELTPIARYMAAEMNVNAASSDVLRMREMNAYEPTACVSDFNRLPMWKQILGLGVTPQQCVEQGMTYTGAALLAWTLKVRQNAEWDHKPKIARMFNPRNPGGLQHWHLYGCTLYFYDVWSNLHYGYVGRAAGFSEAVLLDGAGLEQIGSDVLRGNMPARTPGVRGLRAWDAATDRAAVEAGIRLFDAGKRKLVAQDVLAHVVGASYVLTRPFAP